MSTLDKKYYHNIDLDSNELKSGRIYNLTDTERNVLSSSLTTTDKGYIVYDTTALSLYVWNGTGWTTTAGGSGTVASVSAGTGMSFTTITSSGSVSIDTSKVPYLSGGFNTGFLKWNGSAWVFDNSTYLTSAVTSVGTGTGLTGGTITSTGSISLNSKLAPADNLTGNALKYLRVNAGETAVEYAITSYVHTQNISSTTWNITHNLYFFPNVIVVNSTGANIVGDISYPNNTSLILTFSAAVSGTAYLS
jgi:hypothetical protein